MRVSIIRCGFLPDLAKVVFRIYVGRGLLDLPSQTSSLTLMLEVHGLISRSIFHFTVDSNACVMCADHVFDMAPRSRVQWSGITWHVTSTK